MLMLPWIFKLNNYISGFFIRRPPLFEMFLFFYYIYRIITRFYFLIPAGTADKSGAGKRNA